MLKTLPPRAIANSTTGLTLLLLASEIMGVASQPAVASGSATSPEPQSPSPEPSLARSLAEAPWLLEVVAPVPRADPGAIAPLTNPQTAATIAPPDDNPITFSPRLGLSYNSSGAGYDGFSRLEGFLPLRTSDHSLAFLEGNWRLHENNHQGMTALLGYRRFDPESDRVWGGYIGYDNRATPHSLFHQLGLGFESLGNIDFRINGYIPLGQSRNLYQTDRFDSGSQTTALYFRNHYLMYDSLRMFGETRFYENALGGFDAELGGRVLRFGDQTGLRAYAGLYHYNGPSVAPIWGWRARLEAKPSDTMTLGLALQSDRYFGTNLVASIGVSFPGSSQLRRPLQDSETYLPRLAEAVQRQPVIPVIANTETDIFTEARIGEIAKNPVTGQPWIFRHVTLGAGGGDGTFENPFGAVQAALNTTQSDGNHIVYVDIGRNLDIPGFSIPDRVQVLSRGPVQPLDTLQFGSIQIPLSGTGQFPTIRGTTVTTGPLTGMVALGNSSTLSGFDIQAQGNNGIVGHNVTQTMVRDNHIQNARDGLHLQGTGTSVSSTILRNIVRDATRFGLYLEAVDGGEIANTALRDNIISGTGNDGIRVEARRDSRLTNLVIANNTVHDLVPHGASSIYGDGIDVLIVSGSTATNIAIVDNTLFNLPDDGINIGINRNGEPNNNGFGRSVDDVLIAGNRINNIGFNTHACGAGIETYNNAGNDTVFGNISIVDNVISDTRHGSIVIDSTSHADTPPPNRAGIFAFRAMTGNTSSNPHNGADIFFLLGNGNTPATAATAEFSGIGTVVARNPISAAVAAALQANNNLGANLGWSQSNNRNNNCPNPQMTTQ